MPKNKLEKEEFKVKVLKLKNQIENEGPDVWQGDKNLANKYLNKVLDLLDEYRYWLWKPLDFWGKSFSI